MKVVNDDIYNEYMNFLNAGEIEKGEGWNQLKEMFDNMPITEKRILNKNNPTLYKELTGKNRWR